MGKVTKLVRGEGRGGKEWEGGDGVGGGEGRRSEEGDGEGGRREEGREEVGGKVTGWEGGEGRGSEEGDGEGGNPCYPIPYAISSASFCKV